MISKLLIEGMSIRGISRILEVSSSTVCNQIRRRAKAIKPKELALGKSYQMDELCTYVGYKNNRIWIAYAIRTDTKEVVDFRVGKRSNKTL